MSRLMWRNCWKMLSKNVETFLECDKTYEEADTVLFGAPFDSTTSFRPGTRFGSGAIRHESFGLESYSPYQDRDLRDARIMDSGDLELPFGNTEEVLREIEERAAEILAAGKRPFLLGGEHLVTLGAFRAALKKYPDLCMIHFDAHTDLREDYLGVRFLTPVSSEDAGSWPVTAGFISLGSAPGNGKSFSSERSIPIFMPLPLKVLQRLWTR